MGEQLHDKVMPQSRRNRRFVPKAKACGAVGTVRPPNADFGRKCLPFYESADVVNPERAIVNTQLIIAGDAGENAL